MDTNGTPNKKKGGNRVQVRFQEFVKKLHPDVLRNRLRNFRKFVISATTDKRAENCDEASASNSIIRLPHDCDTSMNSQSVNPKQVNQSYTENGSLKSTNDVSKSQIDDAGGRTCDEKRLKFEKSKLKLDVVIDGIRVPDVIVRKDSINSQNGANEQNPGSSPSNSSKLAINIEATPRNKSPITVQEWVDSLPLTPNQTSRDECEPHESSVVPVVDSENDNLTLGAEAGHLCDKKTVPTPSVNVTITSCQEPSEVESHCSSVDSLLEARKPDPEEVLLSLGFGGTASSSYLETGRIPKRFLKQSQLKGVDIEEFIRQQQDLIYTFESGYYGYRGLAGPSHSNPSVIVAKILEKLREHEKETTSMTSYQLDFRKHCSLEKTPENPPIKFSKVARNVLTKIRCTPGSVLSPDNRKWLDSQGSKSPEIARRLILGQKSFTFGHDGDLIEALSPVRNEEEKQLPTISDNEFEDVANEIAEQLKINAAPEQLDDVDGAIEQAFSSGNFGRRFTDSSTDMSVESIIMKSDLPSRNSKELLSSNSGDRFAHVEITESAVRSSTLKRLNPVDIDDPSSLDIHGSSPDKEESVCDILENACDAHLIPTSSLPECETSDIREMPTDKCRGMSLRDELKDSGIPLNTEFNYKRGSMKKFKNVLTRYSSFEESYKDSDDEFANCSENRSLSEYQSSDKADQYADSATESEFAAYPQRSFINKNIRRQYEELTLLESKLHSLGRPLNVITEDQFSKFSSEQRCTLQTQIIREALKVYLNQLTEDEMHLELKNCLSTEAQKVADLLDGSSDTSKLSIIVRQMTLLLQHQSQLSAQIKELSIVDKKPSSCHEMCDHILKRVHELELLVQQNAQELAQMKYQLLKKNNF